MSQLSQPARSSLRSALLTGAAVMASLPLWACGGSNPMTTALTDFPTADIPTVDAPATVSLAELYNESIDWSSLEPAPIPEFTGDSVGRDASSPSESVSAEATFSDLDVGLSTTLPSNYTFGEPYVGEITETTDPSVARNVIGVDDRIQIQNTRVAPWTAQTSLRIRYSNGQQFICSGTLISPRHVLTAAHCVYDRQLGGHAVQGGSVTVVPGLNGTQEPFGRAIVTRVNTYQGYTQSNGPDYDFALLTLDQPIGNRTGWLGFTTVMPPTSSGYVNDRQSGHLAGYPGDRMQGNALTYDRDAITRVDPLRVWHRIDMKPGQSGSGIFSIQSNSVFGMTLAQMQPRIFAVNVRSTRSPGTCNATCNEGTRITTQRFNDLQRWMQN